MSHTEAEQLAKDLLDHLWKHGCMQGVVDMPPPVRTEAGELRVKGVTLSPTLARLYRAHQEGLRLRAEHLRHAEGWQGEQQEPQANPTAVLVAHGQRYFPKGVGLPEDALQDLEAGARAYLMDPWREPGGGPGLDEEPRPGAVERFIVGPEDEREGLRGLGGLRAARAMPGNTYFAVYRSYAMTQLEYNAFLALEPNKVRQDQIEAYTVEADGGEGWQPMKWDAEHDQLVENHEAWERAVKIVFMGFGYGNVAGLMNAPQKDPFSFLSRNNGSLLFAAKDRPQDLVGPKNATVDFVHVVEGGSGYAEARALPAGVHGFPLPMARTLCAVEAGEELLYCYGYEYWHILKAAHELAVTAMRRIVAFGPAA